MNFNIRKLPEDSKIQTEILSRNINNMFYLSIYMICSECFMLISFIGIKDKLPSEYQYIYLGMYIFLLLFALISAAVLFKRRKYTTFEISEQKLLNIYTHAFVLIVMIWGVIIALLDQPVYGQVIAFVTNYVFCACLLLIRPRVFISIQIIPLALLFLLLPFFQKNSSIILGHYINLAALLIPLTISSYRSYIYFYDNVLNKIKEKEVSEKDELTSLYNRRKMSTFVEEKIIDGRETINSIGVLMLDVDYFKKYNDYYGHLQGDAALQSIGNVLAQMLEQKDVFAARYGGEEFIVIITNKTKDEVDSIALGIKQKINQLKIPHEASKVSNLLTVSIGQCYSIDKQIDIYEMIKKADDSLYEAKVRGRNQIASVVY